jgi:hypothetical protein
MPPIDKNDPEVSYRRGYEHGANEVLRAVAQLLDPTSREILRAWVEEDVHQWRYEALLVYPPLWRLSLLNQAPSQSSAAMP